MANEKTLDTKDKLTPDAVEQLFVARAQGELDMVEAVRKILEEEGFGEEKIALFLNDPNISFASNKNSNVQRFKLNTWLDIQYLATNRQVSMERSMIMDHGSPSVWVDTFKRYHVKFMKQLGLPTSYENFVGVLANGEESKKG